ncbi:unnamed protein product, partial [Closterium sp. NIES-54]
MNRKPVLLSPAKEWRDPIFAAPSPSRKDNGPLTTPRHREPPLSPFRSPLMGSTNPAIPAGSPLGSRSRRALASPVRDVRQADRGDHGGGGGNSKRLAQLCILRTAQAQLNSANPLRPPSSAQPSPIFSAESPSSLLCQAGSALSSSAQARASFESVHVPCSAPSGPMSAQDGAADMLDPFLLPAPAFPLRDQPSSPPPLPVAQPAQAPSAEDTGATFADRGDRCKMAEPPQHADDDATTAAMVADTAEKNVTMARDERNGENLGGQEGNGVGRIWMGGENGAQMGVMRAGKAALAEPLATRAGVVCADRENVGRIDSRGNLGGKRGDHLGAGSRDAQNASVRSTLMELAANKKLPHGPRKGDPMYECKRCPLASPARSPLSHSAALTPPVHLPSRLHIPTALTGLTRGGNGGMGMGRLGLAAPGSCGSSPRGDSSSLWSQQFQQQYGQQQRQQQHQQQQQQQQHQVLVQQVKQLQQHQQRHLSESHCKEDIHSSCVDVKHIALVASKFGGSNNNQGSSSRGRETSPGGYNKGNYNQENYNQGGYNQGSYNQGAYSPQETAYPEQSSYSSNQGNYGNQSFGNQSQSFGNQAGSGGQGGAMDGPVVATDDKGLPRIPRFDGKLNAGQVEALWRDFFDDPVQFFDYREMK